jgi:hypothetical protein
MPAKIPHLEQLSKRFFGFSFGALQCYRRAMTHQLEQAGELS